MASAEAALADILALVQENEAAAYKVLATVQENEAAARKVLATSKVVKEKCAALGISAQERSPRSPTLQLALPSGSPRSPRLSPRLPRCFHSPPRSPSLPLHSAQSQQALLEPLMPRRQSPLLPAPEQVKSILEEAPELRTEDLYSEKGIFQAIARSERFQTFMLLVICSNSIWIGIDTDFNRADVLTDAPLWIQVGENVFCLIFTFEILVRFLAFRRKCDVFTDFSFCFDLALVILMVYETWVEPAIVAAFVSVKGEPEDLGSFMILRITRLGRLLRVGRVGRILRLLQAIPELSILANAMMYALRSVGATLLLLIISIYVFSIYFTQMLSGTEFGHGQFDTVLQGMNTLLVQGILADQADLINGMLDHGLADYVVILVYMLVAALTVANMLVGVICDLIGKVSDAKREENMRYHIQDTIGRILFSIDADHDQMISQSEFGSMLQHEEAAKLLGDNGVDVPALLDYADMIFEDQSRELTYREFMEIALGFRDEDQTMKHELALKRYVKEKMELLTAALPAGGVVSPPSHRSGCQ